jgi:hypothetical protein
LQHNEGASGHDLPVAVTPWDHDDWERWGLALVRERYGVHAVIDVPDAAGGDHGLEAYTTSGVAFQCYSAENEPLAPTKRGALQKKKIGTDIKKFIEGGDSLQSLLGDVVINTWVLLTPYHEDSSVIQYCNMKADEVVRSGVAYASNPFRVAVHHLGTYLGEHQVLLRRIQSEDALIREPDDDVLGGVDFTEAWSDQIEVMDEKLTRLPTLADASARATHRAALLEEQLQGMSLLDRWSDRVPDVATHMRHVLDTARRQLILGAVGGLPPPERYQAVRAYVRERVGAVPSLSDINAEHLTDMALAMWLQECPLDFVES